MKSKSFPSRLTTMLCLLTGALAAHGQNFTPTNWVNDPFCTNQNFTLTGISSASPSFVNNSEQRGTLYANSSIGATLKLERPGEMISCTGQVILAGEINPDGNLQFRLGIFHKGSSTTDTNWLGYLFGNPTGTGGEAKTGLFVRKNPNESIYTSGSVGNVARPPCGDCVYSPGWAAGSYDFSLAVTKLSDKADGITWKLAGIAPNTYNYSGSYTNQDTTTLPPAFDQVAILGGAGLFNGSSTSNSIGFKNLTVSLSK
jgi:hypothetical protein